MRGNLPRAPYLTITDGSIPAYAGEPQPASAPATPGGVYPRVCGGTSFVGSGQQFLNGLSPRMRGNPATDEPQIPNAGSIPAYAGEPRQDKTQGVAQPVYPRVCGGTSISPPMNIVAVGLSPRMRGNPQSAPESGICRRSIPAYAGEPAGAPAPAGLCAVYPRVCGGTRAQSLSRRVRQGLSPRMRGNPSPPPTPTARAGSIPAYAGEPRHLPQLPGGGEVYPRVCGGTSGNSPAASCNMGLSPRMRGNQRRRRTAATRSGSIPAYAGEPRAIALLALHLAVYPRVCGGTAG